MTKKKYVKDKNGLVKATTTTELQLQKPLVNENYDINIFNSNMDKIDKGIKDVKTQLEGVSTDAKSTSFDNSKNGMRATNVQSAIEENKTSIDTVKGEVQTNKTNIASANTKIQTNTTNITNMKAEIESLKSSVDSAKEGIVGAIGDSTLNGNSTFEQIKTHLTNTKTTLKTKLTQKGATVGENEGLSSMVGKVDRLYGKGDYILLDQLTGLNKYKKRSDFTNGNTNVEHYAPASFAYDDEYLFFLDGSGFGRVHKLLTTKQIATTGTTELVPYKVIKFMKYYDGHIYVGATTENSTATRDNIVIYDILPTHVAGGQINQVMIITEDGFPEVAQNIDFFNFDIDDNYIYIILEANNKVMKFDRNTLARVSVATNDITPTGKCLNMYIHGDELYSFGTKGIKKVSTTTFKTVTSYSGEAKNEIMGAIPQFHNDMVYIMSSSINKSEERQPILNALDNNLVFKIRTKGDLPNPPLKKFYQGYNATISCRGERVAMYLDKLYVYDNNLKSIQKEAYNNKTFERGTVFINGEEQIHIAYSRDASSNNSTIRGTIYDPIPSGYAIKQLKPE